MCFKVYYMFVICILYMDMQIISFLSLYRKQPNKYDKLAITYAPLARKSLIQNRDWIM